MADALTEEERAAIDAAVAAGRVTRVPEGVVALTVPAWRWNGKVLAPVDSGTAAARVRSAMIFGRGLRRSWIDVR